MVEHLSQLCFLSWGRGLTKMGDDKRAVLVYGNNTEYCVCVEVTAVTLHDEVNML